jgi:CelD/BcsL family acetyltransferase involved in cellulose biosynthesis
MGATSSVTSPSTDVAFMGMKLQARVVLVTAPTAAAGGRNGRGVLQVTISLAEDGRPRAVELSIGPTVPLRPTAQRGGLSSDCPQWVDRDASLEYFFAGRRLNVFRFRGRVCTAAWAARPAIPADAEVAGHLTDRGMVMWWSQPVPQPLPRVAIAHNAIRYVARQYERYTVSTTGRFDDYVQRLSSKTRQTLRRKVRRYCEHVGSARPWRQFASAVELGEFYHLARQVSARTYQERLLGAGLPPRTEFVERVHAAGAARGYVLFAGSAPVAFLFTPIDDGRAVYTSLGYDPAYARWSPGAVLQYFAIASMFDDPDVAILDFAEGEGQHKATFATGSARCADIYYFRLNIRSVAAIAVHLMLSGADRALVRALQRLRLKSHVRRMVRR